MSIDPNVIPFGRRQALDPETNIIIGKAFDAAWTALGVTDEAKDAQRMRDLLARRIIDMAQRGERDITLLRDDALAHLAES